MSDSHPLPDLAVLLPEGWARLRFDETIDAQVADVVAFVLRGVEPRRRDIARVHLKRMLGDAVSRAGDTVHELWLPIAPTGGVTIPVTVTVAAPPSPLDPGRSASDHLTAFAAAAAGSRFLEVGGRPAVRTFSDVPGAQSDTGEWTALPRRRLITIVAPPPGGEWLVFFAEIVVPQDGAAEIVEACEFFVDAFLTTVRFPVRDAVPEPAGGR